MSAFWDQVIPAVLTLVVVQEPSPDVAVDFRESIVIHLLPPFIPSPSILSASLHTVTASYLDAKESVMFSGPQLLFGSDTLCVGEWFLLVPFPRSYSAESNAALPLPPPK